MSSPSRTSDPGGFLVEDFKGHWATFWRPSWTVWKWTTLILGVYFLFILFFQTDTIESFGDVIVSLLAGIGFAAYVALFIAIPIGLLALGWRLFGWGLVLAVVLAPLAFWLTFDLLDDWMLDLGQYVQTVTATSYARHGLPTLDGSNPAARIGGGGAFAIVILPFIIIGLLMDVLAVVGDGAVVMAVGEFIGAVLLVLVLSCIAAVVVALPVLVLSLVTRTRKRLRSYRADRAAHESVESCPVR